MPLPNAAPIAQGTHGGVGAADASWDASWVALAWVIAGNVVNSDANDSGFIALKRVAVVAPSIMFS